MNIFVPARKTGLRFQRQELKYWIDEKTEETLRAQLQELMRPDAHAGPGPHGAYRIDSLYLEAIDARCYWDKIEGLEKRRKFRFRVYGEPSKAEKVFVEIKRKVNSTILKARVPLSLEEFRAYWQRDEFPERLAGREEQRILESFFYYRHEWCLQPLTLVSYWREAYQALDDDRVRVTFDKEVCAAPVDTFDPTAPHKMFEACGRPGKTILEIKLNGFMPDWLYQIVRQHNLQREAISKYCLGAEVARLDARTYATELA